MKALLPVLLAGALLATPAVAQKTTAKKASTSAATTTATYKLEPQLSTLGWVGKKVTGQHNGTVDFKEGEVLVKGNQVTGGTFVVDMTTLKDEDIKDAGGNGKLVGHLKSEDFFSVEKNPTATFKITSLAPIKGAAADADNMTVTGDLTIKGITNSITFPAKVGVKNGLAAASGTATVDRTKYDIKFRSKSFFENLGDKVIDNDFMMTFNVIAKQPTSVASNK
ncbi:YceI family protein [Hymenobacter crusticola]|uniref:Lipid-binding protein n=1 Tax=Hymenobacter crusticola TaxID=1770526 RepID=A0A243WJU3_9BACT|nr:YceI family protein [Hymenobacter crusticola]OUJ76174.1 lipid-binding protein [Hymenobacter crusticola]